MIDVFARIYEVTHPNGLVEFYETVSVNDLASKTRRATANSQLTDAKSILSTQSNTVKSRVGVNGATLKLACLLRNNCNVVVTSFASIGGPFNDRETAEKFRDDYLSSYTGTNQLLGRAGFRFVGNGNGKSKKSTFYQPISGDKKIALNRIETLISHFAMTFNLTNMAGVKMSDGTPVETIGQLLFNGAYRKPNPNNVATIGNVKFTQGEFNNYGEIFKMMLDAQIIN